MSLRKSAAAGGMLAIAVFFAIAANVQAQVGDRAFDAISRNIQTQLEGTYGPDQPGAAVLVTIGDREIIRTAVGQANLELAVDLQPEMSFRIASITKQFTAAAILRLQDEGRLSVDDTIGMHLPEYPAHAAGITLRQLLNQTSGLDSHHTHTPVEVSVQDLIAEFSHLPLTFEPGSRFEYNNNNYNLLGAIIERLTGQSYGEYLQANLFEPLGLENTAFDNPRVIIPGRAAGYMGDIGRLTNARYVSMSVPYAAGALISTADDLTSWNKALFGGDVISPAALAQMAGDTVPMDPGGHDHGSHDGAAGEYGFGLFVGEIAGFTKYTHSGGVEGFGSYNLYIPELDLSIVILQNSSSWAHPQVLAEWMAEEVLNAVLDDTSP